VKLPAPIRHPRAFLAAMILIAGLSAAVAHDVPSHLSNKISDFTSHHSESFLTAQELEAIQPEDSPGIPDIAVLVWGGDAAFEAVWKLRELPQVDEVASLVYQSHNSDRYAVLAWLKPNLPAEDASVRVARSMREPGVMVGGPALATREFSELIKNDLRRAELIAMPLLALLGFLIFRSAVAALLPVVVGGVAVVTALALIRVATDFIPVSIFSLNIVSGLALGLGVDYSLLMVSRFREELGSGGGAAEAAAKTLRSAGRTIAFSAAVIVVAFLSLLVFPVPFVRSMAFGGILVALVAAAVALLFLPSLFVLLGQRVNALAPQSWRRGAEASGAVRQDGRWYRIARFVMRRPLPIALCCGIAMVAIALPSFSMRLTGLDFSSLPVSSDAREFAEEIREKFENPLLGEIAIAVHGSAKAADRLAARVESLSRQGEQANVLPQAIEHSPRLWQVNLNPAPPVFSDETIALVERLRRLGGNVAVTGETAAYMDTSATQRHYLPWALAILIVGTFLVLALATGSLVLPLKALIMNALSLGAAFGLLVLVFQEGRLEGLLGYESQGAVVLALPLALAAGAFGLLTDYGLFLLMRIKEIRETGVSDREAIGLGLERTGKTVTAAALMFAVAVGSVAVSGVVFIKEGALGITCAVLLDAFVVRPLLVPSLMAILGRWNWWPGRLWRRRAYKEGAGTTVSPRPPL
jgi:RND superfamily putative drug exporter